MQKPRLYLDFDGCVADTIASIVSLYDEDFQAYPNFTYIKPQNIHTWNFEECNCATTDIINTYFCTPRFFERLEFMEHADSILWLLSYQFNITIVSLGETPNLKLKKKWIRDNFSLCIRNKEEKIMVNHAYVDFIGVDFKNYDDKSHIDMSDGIFVDDSTKNLITSNAKHKIVFGEYYPWNQDDEGMTRCLNWIDLYREITSIYNMEYKTERNII